MDDPDHGVLVTVIDLGLSRMNSHDGYDANVHWTPFDEEVFEGEGDYQFDVYRMMRAHNRDQWAEFRPLTNVMVSPLIPFHLQFRDGLITSRPTVATLPGAQASAVQAPPAARDVPQERGDTAVSRIQRTGVLRLHEGGRSSPRAVSRRCKSPGAAQEGAGASAQDPGLCEGASGGLGTDECWGTPRHC